MLDTIEAELNLPLSTNDVIVQQNGELRNEEIGSLMSVLLSFERVCG